MMSLLRKTFGIECKIGSRWSGSSLSWVGFGVGVTEWSLLCGAYWVEFGVGVEITVWRVELTEWSLLCGAYCVEFGVVFTGWSLLCGVWGGVY
jgi:hypothetical protein